MNECERELLDYSLPPHEENPLWRLIAKDLSLIFCGKEELFNLSKKRAEEFYKILYNSIQKNKKTLEEWKLSLRNVYR